MWVAAKKIDHPKYQIAEGMPLPHQGHAGFRERLKQLFGANSVKWVDEVRPEQLLKVKTEIALLQKDNVRLKAQNEQLTAQVKELQKKLAK